MKKSHSVTLRVAITVLAVAFSVSKGYASDPSNDRNRPVGGDYIQHVLDYYDYLLREWGWDITDEDQTPECSEGNETVCA